MAERSLVWKMQKRMQRENQKARGYYGITSCIYLTNLETGAGEIVINGEEMAQLVKEELPVISVVFEFRVEEGGELIQTPKLPIPVVLK